MAGKRWDESLEEQLRRRILAAFHRGSRKPGDRLPSIRRLSDELDEDHRAVARAYHRLAEEGLVDIRPRSGVYLAPQQRMGDRLGIASETASWIAEVVYEGWQRHMSPLGLLDTLRSAVRPTELQAACVETAPDPLEALSRAVEDAVSVPCRRILVAPKRPGAGWDLDEVLDDPPDFVVTTVYHADVREVLAAAGVPTLVLGINAEWVATLRRWAQSSGLTVVVAAEPTRVRFRDLLGSEAEVSFLDVSETASTPPPRRSRIYATVLARQALRPAWARKAKAPNAHLLDPRTVRELAVLLVHGSLRS